VNAEIARTMNADGAVNMEPADLPPGVIWADEDAGPVVRPYALTAGRTRPHGEEFDLIAVVVASRPPSASDGGLGSECAEIMRLCQRPQSVAEISSHLSLPVGVVRVLLVDLLDRGLIRRRAPVSTAQLPTDETFRAVINEIRSL
jgi:hypothetical protein